MRHVPSNIGGLTALAISLEQRPKVIDGTGMLLLNGQWQGIPKWASGLLDEVIGEIESITALKVGHVSINVIVSGGGSGLHIDPTPLDGNGKFERFARWHLPLSTNAQCWFEDATHPRFHMAEATWHGPVEYWLTHAVGNDGTTPRMHLVVDLH